MLTRLHFLPVRHGAWFQLSRGAATRIPGDVTPFFRSESYESRLDDVTGLVDGTRYLFQVNRPGFSS